MTRARSGQKKNKDNLRRRRHTGDRTPAYLMLVHLERSAKFFEAKTDQQATESFGDWVRRRRPCVRPRKLIRRTTKRKLDHGVAVLFAVRRGYGVTTSERDVLVVQRFARERKEAHISDLEERVRKRKEQEGGCALAALEGWAKSIVDDALGEMVDARVRALPGEIGK
jgi:hypothetical protein